MRWPHTAISKLLHLDFPLIQAPMAGYTTPDLVAGISQAGGLGSLGGGYMMPEELQKAIESIRQKTRNRFNVNLFCPSSLNKDLEQIQKAQNHLNLIRKKLGLSERNDIPNNPISFDEQCNILIDQKVPVFSFTFGIPSSKHLQAMKRNGTILLGTATNLEEARALEESGVDAIIAQGAEAGGHRSTFIGTPADSLIGLMNLVPQITAATKLPVIAAGGIMNAKGIVAALDLGASGVQLGTAFLAANESGASECFKTALREFSQKPTIISRVFSGKEARMIKTKGVVELEELCKEIADYPYQNLITQDIRKKSTELNNPDYIPLYAGEGFSLISTGPALEIFYELVQNTSFLLKPNP